MGINLGDIIIEEDGDIYGDGVNVATRLEQLAEPGSISISGKVFDEVEGKLATAFAFTGEKHMKNLARSVRVYSSRPAPEFYAKPLPPRDKPSIAVLPFSNMSGDPDQQYFADGMVEEIITAPSKYQWLMVIARNSSFTYNGRAVDVKQVGRELDVRYVLAGSVRKAGRRLRITGLLIEATTGAHLWADHFDGDVEQVFELQDQVTSSVVEQSHQGWNRLRSSEPIASLLRVWTPTICFSAALRIPTGLPAMITTRRCGCLFALRN